MKSMTDLALPIEQVTTGAPTVLIYRTHLLPLSETFVRDQAAALERWRPVLVGERAVGGLALGLLRVATLHQGRATPGQRVSGGVSHLLDRPPRRLEALARAQSPALVHAHFGFDGVSAWPLARRLGVPLLVTLHGSDVTVGMEWYRRGHGGWRGRFYPTRFARLGHDGLVRFIAVSNNIRRAAIDAGVPDERITVLPIGIDVRRFVRSGPLPSRRPPRILFVGRLTEKKGCVHLIEAFEAVVAQKPDAELLIAGDGDQREALERRASGLGQVTFLGAVPHERVMALMQEARVFCLPSITARNGDAEGLPIVLLEAQACGVPVVTSARGGSDEGIQPGVTGFACAERDAGTLAALLLALLRDDALADRFSEAGPAYVAAHHNITTQTRRLEAVYDETVASHRRAVRTT